MPKITFASSYLPQEELDLINKRAEAQLEKHPELSYATEEEKSHAIAQLIETTKQANKYGNKTANLIRLSNLFSPDGDVVVPQFQGISHEDILNFLSEEKLNALWSEFTSHISEGRTIESASDILNKIQKLISEAFLTPPSFLSDELIQQFSISNQKMMVRSTGREDTLKIANPGGNESIANVQPTRGEISKAIGMVIASYFSTKSLGQRQSSGEPQ